jgi:hypothetical protein
VLTAEGARTAAILRAEGEAKAIDTVFRAIHAGAPDERLLSYQYLQMLPQLARGDSNKVFVIPSEFSQAFANLRSAVGMAPGEGAAESAVVPAAPPPPAPAPASLDAVDARAAADAADAARAAQEAAAEADSAANPLAPTGRTPIPAPVPVDGS